MQLARIAEPEADWLAARAHLSEIAQGAAALPRHTDLAERAASLAGLLVGRHRYVGDTQSYDDLDNANLIRVTQRRCGLPVAIGILWLHAAQAAGWAAHGVNFPGHFLIVLRGPGGPLPIDVFAGGTPLSREDVRTLLKRALGVKAEPGPNTLAAMSSRDVLLRLQVNIKQRLLMLGQMQAALACTEDMLRIATDEALLWREAAIMNQRLDRVAAAVTCFDRFLTLVPRGDAAARARAARDELRGRLN